MRNQLLTCAAGKICDLVLHSTMAFPGSAKTENASIVLVPSFATGSTIDLSAGVVANGQAIQLYGNNGTAARRWLLK